MTNTDLSSLRAAASSLGKRACALSSAQAGFAADPKSLDKAAYLAWRGERRAAYREAISVIRGLKAVARSPETDDHTRSAAQSWLHAARSHARDLMASLDAMKTLRDNVLAAGRAEAA